MSPRLVSVNVGRPHRVVVSGRARLTSIGKHPVEGRVEASIVGLDGDTVSDLRRHGGIWQAVYAYSAEDLAWWSDELGGSPLPPGRFGENLTTGGLDLNACELGEVWRVGSVLLQVVSVRMPCTTFAAAVESGGHDATGWVRRFVGAARPGPYLRVLEEGFLRAGDGIEVVERQGHGVTVETMFRAQTLEPDLLPELLRVDGLADEVYARARLATAQPA